MKVLRNKLTWEQASEAVSRGNFIRHSHWCAKEPIAQPDYVGPTAAGADGKKMAVYTDDGILVHAYEPSAPEKASSEWQEVTLARELGASLQEALVRAANAGAGPVPAPVLVTPTAAEVAALSQPRPAPAAPAKRVQGEVVRARRRPAG